MDVAESRMVAGLQVIFGYLSVTPPVPSPVAVGPFVSTSPGARPSLAPARSSTNVSFAVRPPNIRNPLWLVFRGSRDPRTGCLDGEIVPDFSMRLLGLAPSAMFAVVGIGLTIASVLVPLATGDHPDLFALVWTAFVVAFMIGWVRSYGAAAHAAALNVRCDSPEALLAWHPGLRCGSRPIAPPPPPPTSTAAQNPAPSPWAGPGKPAVTYGGHAARSATSAWLGLLGLVVPIAIVMLFIWPAIRSRDDSTDWVKIDGVAGAEVDLDHRTVTYVLPDGTQKTGTVSVMRTVEEGDSVELYYPPGRPDLIEQDRSGFVLPYIVFGGFAVLVAGVIIGQFVIGLRRSRRPEHEPR